VHEVKLPTVGNVGRLAEGKLKIQLQDQDKGVSGYLDQQNKNLKIWNLDVVVSSVP
jgi:hypothetical protein